MQLRSARRSRRSGATSSRRVPPIKAARTARACRRVRRRRRARAPSAATSSSRRRRSTPDDRAAVLRGVPREQLGRRRDDHDRARRPAPTTRRSSAASPTARANAATLARGRRRPASPSGRSRVLFLSSDPTSNNVGTPLTCPVTPAVVSRRHRGLQRHDAATGIGKALAHHHDCRSARTTSCRTAARRRSCRAPSCCCRRPRGARTTSPRRPTPTQRARRGASSSRPQDGTTVMIVADVDAARRRRACRGAARTRSRRYTLDAGQYIQWQDSGDMAGSVISVEQAGGVHRRHRLPVPDVARRRRGGGCDSGAPEDPAGVGARLRVRRAAVRDAPRRPAGGVDPLPLRRRGRRHARSRYDPPIAGRAGDARASARSSSSRRSARSRSRARTTCTRSTSASTCRAACSTTPAGSRPATARGCLGDEEFVNILPPAQWLSSYVFFTDPTYATTNLVVMRKATRRAFQDVTLDCLGTLVRLEAGRRRPASTRSRTSISQRGDAGRHVHQRPPLRDERRRRSALMVWGLDSAASYAYPGRRQRREDQPGRRDRPHLVSGNPQPARARGARARAPCRRWRGTTTRAAPTTSAACVATSTRSTSSRCTTACSSTSRAASSRRPCSASAIAMPIARRADRVPPARAPRRRARERARRRRRRHDLHAVDAVEHAPSRTSSRRRAAPVWFQLYVYRDRGATEALVRRVEAAGCRALVLTVDAPLLGRRERDVHNRFALPPRLGVENLLAAGYARLPRGRRRLRARRVRRASCSIRALTWDAIELAALDHEAAGARQGHRARRRRRARGRRRCRRRSSCRTTAAASSTRRPRRSTCSRAIVDAVAGRGEVLLDGGVRRGTDVVKALALGARAVLVGRPVLWGLAAGGRAGVAAALGDPAPRARSRDGAVRLPRRREHHARSGGSVTSVVLGRRSRSSLATIAVGVIVDRKIGILPRPERARRSRRSPRPPNTPPAKHRRRRSARRRRSSSNVCAPQRCPRVPRRDDHPAEPTRSSCSTASGERSLYVASSQLPGKWTTCATARLYASGHQNRAVCRDQLRPCVRYRST